jgi:hypothetical protein
METVHIIILVVAGVLLLLGCGFFNSHVEKKYSYKLFSKGNLIMLSLIVLSWGGIIFARYILDIAAVKEPIYYIICGVVTGVLLFMLFFNNLARIRVGGASSWGVAILVAIVGLMLQILVGLVFNVLFLVIVPLRLLYWGLQPADKTA